jgi:hypothetical protein
VMAPDISHADNAETNWFHNGDKIIVLLL